MKKLLLLSSLFFVNQFIFSQSVAQQRCDRFEKGMNLSNWMEAYWQTGWPTANGYTRADLVKMKEAGIKSIRLPIGFASVTDTLPPYNVDTTHVLFARIDTVISWCDELGLNMIIDNHHNWDIFNQNWRTKIDRFSHMWSVVSEHYKYLDPERYTFELLNEPAFGIALDSLNIVFSHAIDSIRQHTTGHSIIASPNFSSNGAAFVPYVPFADTNIIYTWHSYDPYQFTHQGFTWAQPQMPLGTTFPGAYDQGLYNAWTGVLDWRNTYHKPVFLGEFGTGEFGDAASRCNWLQFFGNKIDSFNMPWFYWDWRWDFSLFNSHIVSEDSVIPCFKHALHLYGDTLISSVNNLKAEELQAEIFPNPASPATGCNVLVSDAEETTLAVYDVAGRKIYETLFNRQTALPVHILNSGIYLLTLQCRNKIARRKLVLD